MNGANKVIMAASENNNLVDRVMEGLLNYPIIAVFVVFAIVVIGLATFTDAITKLRKFFSGAKKSSDLTSEFMVDIIQAVTEKHQHDLSTQQDGHETEVTRLQAENDALKDAIRALANNAGDPALQGRNMTEVLRRLRQSGDTAESEGIFATLEHDRAANTAQLKEAAAFARHRGALARWRDAQAAVAAYREATELDPDYFEGWIELARAAKVAGDLGQSELASRQASTIAADADDRRNQGVAHSALGDTLTARGDHDGALNNYQTALDIAKVLADSDPSNADLQRDLSVSYDKIGDMLTAQGDRDGALNNYQAGLDIAKTLVDSDPGNVDWQRDLSVSNNKIGDMLTAQGDHEAALNNYRAALQIRKILADSDPGNANWQRDISVSYNRIGHILTAQGDHDGALNNYQSGLGIAKALADSDPSNAEWLRDLSINYDTIGNILTAQGNRDGAISNYRAGLDIAEALADSDPGNVDWQRGLSISNYNLALAVLEDDGATAAIHLRKAADILRTLKNSGRLLPTDGEFLSKLEAHLLDIDTDSD